MIVLSTTNTPSSLSPRTNTAGEIIALADLCTLWNHLSEICVTEDGEEIDESFLHFEPGTPLSAVWAWFEEKNVLFVAGTAGNSIGLDHPFRAFGLIEQALSYIASIHPTVSQVVYDNDLRWLYSTSNGEPVRFGNTGNTFFLEQAADEAYDRGLQNVVISLHPTYADKGRTP